MLPYPDARREDLKINIEYLQRALRFVHCWYQSAGRSLSARYMLEELETKKELRDHGDGGLAALLMEAYFYAEEAEVQEAYLASAGFVPFLIILFPFF